MKLVVVFIIQIYKVVLSPLVHQLVGVGVACRYQETCSVYAQRVIKEYGILYGSQLALKRLLACQPFGKN